MDTCEFDSISRFQNGDEHAFEELVTMYRERLYSLAWQWTGNKDDALDLCQNAFIKLYHKLNTWKPGASIFTWLYRVVINMAIDAQRKKSRRKQVSLDAVQADQTWEVPDTKLRHPSEDVDNKALQSDINHALTQLPKRQKKAFILRQLHGLSIKQVAEMMKCSEGAVKAHMYQATRKLRTLLKEHWLPGTEK